MQFDHIHKSETFQKNISWKLLGTERDSLVKLHIFQIKKSLTHDQQSSWKRALVNVHYVSGHLNTLYFFNIQNQNPSHVAKKEIP